MPRGLCKRKIFLSSTIRNLQKERAAIYARLQRPFNHVEFDIIASDRPETLHMSGDDLQTRAGYNPNLFILNQIRYADYYVILLNDTYYGETNIRDPKSVGKQERIISITHAEFRAAFRHAQPIFAFIDQHTWYRYLITFGGKIPFYKIWNKDSHVYGLIREIRRYHKGINVTISIFSSPTNLINKMERIFNTYDKSKYVFSEFDEEVCNSGDVITAIWEVINEGCVVWKNRFFKEQNPSLRRFIRESGKSLIKPKKDIPFPTRFITFIKKWFQYVGIIIRGRKSTAEKTRYPIGETYPGETVRLTVRYIAPQSAGEVVSSWAMVASEGKKIYRNHVPLEAEYFVERTKQRRKDLFSKQREKCADRRNS